MTLELHETAAIRAVLRDEWDALQPRLLAIAQRVVRRREVAEDVVSATVIELIGRVDAGEDIRDPGAYLARGVRFRAIDVVRSKDGQAVVGSEVADDAIASIADTRLGAMAVDDLDALAPVREAFGALSTRHRDVLARTVLDDEPVKDVARDMGMSPNAVAVLALRARRALRTELQAVLMERAGGECAVHARSKDRSALAHVARCDHCLEVRGGRGFGRWVFAVVPLLVGGGAVAVAPANVAQAVVGTVLRKPAIAATTAVGAAAAATVVVVASVAAFAPTVAPGMAAPPAASAPAATPATQAPVAPAAAPAATQDAAPQTPVAAPVETIVGPGASAPIVVPVAATPRPAPVAATPPAPVAPTAPVDRPAPADPPAPTEPPIVVPPTDPEPPITEPEPPVTEPEPPVTEPEPPVTEPEPPVTEPEPDPDPVVPTPPSAGPLTPGEVVYDSLLGVVSAASVTVSGLVPGATYQLAAPNDGLRTSTAVSGMDCMGETCIAIAETATFTVSALDALVLCATPTQITLTPAASDQAQLTVPIDPQAAGLCLLEIPGLPPEPVIPPIEPPVIPPVVPPLLPPLLP